MSSVRFRALTSAMAAAFAMIVVSCVDPAVGLREAAAHNDVEALRGFIPKARASVQDSLSVAVKSGSLEAVKVLLDEGAAADHRARALIINGQVVHSSGGIEYDVMQVGDGDGPLPQALAAKHAKIARVLLQKGANPNRPVVKSMDLNVLVDAEMIFNESYAGRTSTVDLGRIHLTAAGNWGRMKVTSNVEPIPQVTKHLLRLAAELGDSEAVAVLLEAGADPRVVDADGQTPANAARNAGFPELAAKLEGAK